MPDFNVFLIEFPIFHTLDAEQLDYLEQYCQKEMHFHEGTIILEKDEPQNYIYVILLGNVDIYDNDKIISKKGIGAFLCYSTLIEINNKAMCKAVARTKVRVKCLPLPILLFLSNRN